MQLLTNTANLRAPDAFIQQRLLWVSDEVGHAHFLHQVTRAHARVSLINNPDAVGGPVQRSVMINDYAATTSLGSKLSARAICHMRE